MAMQGFLVLYLIVLRPYGTALAKIRAILLATITLLATVCQFFHNKFITASLLNTIAPLTICSLLLLAVIIGCWQTAMKIIKRAKVLSSKRKLVASKIFRDLNEVDEEAK